MDYRTKSFFYFGAFLAFWFLIFYPRILPYINEIKLNPLLAVALFEGLLYITILMLTRAVLNETSHKWALIIFLIYHIVDSVEPPQILTSSGIVDIMNPTAIISWDYAIGSALKGITGWSWKTLYYVVNIGVLSALLGIVIEFTRPGKLKATFRKVLL